MTEQLPLCEVDAAKLVAVSGGGSSGLGSFLVSSGPSGGVRRFLGKVGLVTAGIAIGEGMRSHADGTACYGYVPRESWVGLAVCPTPEPASPRSSHERRFPT